MAHLFHDELGNQSYYDEFGAYRGAGNFGLQNDEDFSNLQSGHYWSGTDYAALTRPAAWYFGTALGNQGLNVKDTSYSAMAVRPGLAVVPEPISSTLFLIGGATLGFRRFRKTITN